MGDSFADLIEREQLGIVVPYEDEQAIAKAILDLIDDPQKMKEIKENSERIRHHFYWTSVTAPLKQMIKDLVDKPSITNRWTDVKILSSFFVTKIKERGLSSCLRQYLFPMTHRS
jgi:hypothetical protein